MTQFTPGDIDIGDWVMVIFPLHQWYLQIGKVWNLKDSDNLEIDTGTFIIKAMKRQVVRVEWEWSGA